MKKLLPYAVLGVSIFLNLVFFRQLQQANQGNLVERVIDGDTFVLNWGQRVRLKGLDAPDIKLCLGEKAKIELEKLVLGKKVRLEEPVTDNYGRILAFVYQDSLFVDEVMLKKGLGRFGGSPSPKQSILSVAFKRAQTEQIGIFSEECHQKENPLNPKCSIKGNFEKPSGEKWYHFPGCREYNQTIVEKDLGEQWFCTEKEAQEAGFKKASNCYEKSFK